MSEPNVRQILFLSQHAVRQRGFINAFFVKAKELVPKSLILHETGVDDPKVNWFVSKRISGGLSEQMIPNNALYTERTKHKVENGDGLELDVNRVVKEMANVTALVDNPVAWHAQTQQPKAIETSIWLSTMHKAFPDAEVLIFPDNPESAIGINQPLVNSEADARALKEAFPEEERIIQLALEAAPARIVLVSNFLQRDIQR